MSTRILARLSPAAAALPLTLAVFASSACSDDEVMLAAGAATTDGDAGAVPPAEAGAATPAPPANDSTSSDDAVTTARNVPVRIDVRANDVLVGDWDITAVSKPSRGVADIASSAEIRFTPAPDEKGGVVTFGYTLRLRGSSETRTGNVTVTILADLGSVSGGQLYRANDDSTVDSPLGFGWMAIANDGRMVGGEWSRGWFVQAPDGTRTTVPFPSTAEVVERAILGFGAGGQMVGYYTLLASDQSYSSVSVSWPGGAAPLREVARGVNQVYGSNARGTFVGSNIHVYPETYAGVWLEPNGAAPPIARVFTHPDAAITGSVFYDIGDDDTVLGYTDTSPGRCYLLDKGTAFKPLTAPALPGWERQRCFGMNEKREIVGTASLDNYNGGRAFRITADGTWHRLVFPFPRRDGEENRAEEARAINDAGVIVGVQTARENVRIGDITERRTVWHPVRFTPITAGAAARFDDTIASD